MHYTSLWKDVASAEIVRGSLEVRAASDLARGDIKVECLIRDDDLLHTVLSDRRLSLNLSARSKAAKDDYALTIDLEGSWINKAQFVLVADIVNDLPSAAIDIKDLYLACESVLR